MSIKLLFFLVLLILSHINCRTFNKFFQSVQLQGTWREFSVMSPIGPCEPCHYKISFDNSDAKFQIYNSQDTEQVYDFPLTRLSDQNQIVFLDRSVKYQSQNLITIVIESLPRDGTLYNYVVQFKNIGLFIDSSQKVNQYAILVKALVFTGILWAFVPIYKKQIQKSMIQLHKRTCLFSLCLYGQLIATISALHGILLIQYVFNSQSYIQKILCYCLLGFSFLSCVVHLTFTLAIVQKKLNDFLPRQSIYKCAITFLGIFIGIIMYPLLIVTFHKGVWYFYFMISGLIAQFLISINMKRLPYHKFLVLYSTMIVYLALQTDDYPVLNFSQISYFHLMLLFIIMIVVNLCGAWALRNTGNIENIAQMFGINSDQQKRSSSTKNTQNERQIDQSVTPSKKMYQIKSDIELQPTND